MSTTTFGWLILLCPLVGTTVIGLAFQRLPGRSAGWIATSMIALSFAFSVAALLSLLSHGTDHRELTSTLWRYDSTVGVDAKLSILVDPLSVFMALVVSGVSALIHLYSVSYMTSDRGDSRYFAYLNYFVLSMLLLVLAGNFLLLIVGWAFVGAASYLLISFWYRRTTATNAGLKAFVINVVGDVGLVLGTFFLFKHTGTLDFLKTFREVPQVFTHNDTDLTVACLLLLVGAFAKSAQVPLHTWLPDAMEGPTPVSALIHAATMVTAGVYLIARMHPLFEQAPTAADVGAIGGCLTLLIAATVGLVVTDIKRVIAYSTMSQIGYMIMGVSVGAYSAGLFHLMTHAFFKALLFMGAGSLIGAMAGVQSLDRMGGFRKALPFTFACFLIGGLALSGLPPFSGWLSKDDVIAFLDHRGGGFLILGIAGYVGALLTAIYTFRMIFRAFFGDPVPEARELEQGHLAHAEVPRNPLTRRGGGHRRRVPRPRAPHRRARGADEDRDEHAGAAGGGRRCAPDPGRRRRGHEVPRSHVRGLEVRPRGGEAGIGVAGADRRRGDRGHRHRGRLPSVGRRPRHGHASARATARGAPVPAAQVVLRRADRLRGRTPHPVGRALCQLGARAGGDRRRRDWRHDRDRAGRLGRGAPRPDRLRALLRGRDGACACRGSLSTS